VSNAYRDIYVSEPRIGMIKTLLEELLRVVELENDGEPVKVNGFRLRDLQDWVVKLPSVTPNMLLQGLAPGCNASCRFCYIKGTPPDWGFSTRSLTSVKDELYDEEAGQALFWSLRQWYEPFSSPDICECLALIRQKSDQWLYITTNGRGLTEAVIDQLAELGNIFLTVSLNSANPAIRSELMRDPTPEVAISSLGHLRRRGIPFAVSHVPWPSVPLSDLRESILFADEAGAESVRVSLPGYTKYNGDDAGWFDIQQYWTQVVRAILPLRYEIEAPLVIYPYLFEEPFGPAPLNSARIVGIGRDSPAKSAGLQIDDVIVAVNGTPVISRPHARDLLWKAVESGANVVHCTVTRDGELLDFVLETAPTQFRYLSGTPDNPYGSPFGIYLPSGFRRQTLTLLKRAIREAGARCVLVPTTQLMKPLLDKALSESDFWRNLDAEVHFVIPQNIILGGAIIMGDLLTNPDLIACIEDFKRTNCPPDLVCLSSSIFTPVMGWMRDVNGHYYKEIERVTGVPIRIIPHEIITW